MWKRIGGIFLVGVAAVAILAMLNINGHRADPRDYFSDPQTLTLAEAMQAGETGKMAELIAAGADPNARGKGGITLLEWDISREAHVAYRELLKLGADPNAVGWENSTAMHLAAQYFNDSYLKVLVAAGGNVNVRDQRMGRSPIFSALMSRRADNIAFLIEHGADLDLADRNGVRPLQLAARINDFDHVLMFLELGADPLVTDDTGTTFQTSIFRSDPKLLNGSAQKARDAIIAFLEAKGVPLDPKARRAENAPQTPE